MIKNIVYCIDYISGNHGNHKHDVHQNNIHDNSSNRYKHTHNIITETVEPRAQMILSIDDNIITNTNNTYIK